MRRSLDLDTIGKEPLPGEVWLCEGNFLRFNDGGKTRPVLVINVGAQEVLVIPLTSRKPASKPVPVAHQGGISWMTGEQRAVPRLALLSARGYWTGFSAWQRS